MLRPKESPSKSQRKVVQGSDAIWKESFQKGCVCQGSYPRKFFYVNEEDWWDQNTPSDSPQAPGTKFKFGKESVHREELSQSVNVMSVVHARQNSREDHIKGDLAPRRMRPQSCMGFDETYFYKLKNADKATFHTPIEARALPAPSPKRREEKEFVVDSGASVHKLSKKD